MKKFITFLMLFFIMSNAYCIINLLKALSDINRHNREELYQLFLAPQVTPSRPEQFTLTNIAGELPADITAVIDIIKHSEKYHVMGARMPKGIILYGPPGTGKTSLAKAIAGETEAAFFAASGSQFVELYVGNGPKKVRELFDEARLALKNGSALSIIFIDEIDAIGGRRTQEMNSEYRNTLNELLNQLDGCKSTHGIFVIAATNNLSLLDPALIRAGRFDLHVKIDLPNETNRCAILKLYLDRTKNSVSEETIKKIAQHTKGQCAADLEALVNQAAVAAVQDDAEYLADHHILNLLKK